MSCHSPKLWTHRDIPFFSRSCRDSYPSRAREILPPIPSRISSEIAIDRRCTSRRRSVVSPRRLDPSSRPVVSSYRRLGRRRIAPSSRRTVVSEALWEAAMGGATGGGAMKRTRRKGNSRARVGEKKSRGREGEGGDRVWTRSPGFSGF